MKIFGKSTLATTTKLKEKYYKLQSGDKKEDLGQTISPN